MVRTIRIDKGTNDPRGLGVLKEIKRRGIGISAPEVATVTVYHFESEGCIRLDTMSKLGQALIDVGEVYAIDQNFTFGSEYIWSVLVGYKPGVMNPEAESLLKMALDLGLGEIVAANSAVEYHFTGVGYDNSERQIIEEMLKVDINRVVLDDLWGRPATLMIKGVVGPVETVLIRDLDNEALKALSKDKLFLNLDEMKVIQDHYRVLGRDATDVEVETFAQTWSEHCGHKTFRARIIADGVEKAPLIKRLKDTSSLYFDDKVLSAFVDNSGVVVFYDGYAICGKVETHNSPSAIEPYGGAATGSGGVFRDILGTGQGALVIASTDMFCFAPPDLDPQEVPDGCLPPEYLLRRVVDGVRDYGNRMGIPTCNGSVHFHPDFVAKPSVIVGAIGIMPAARATKGEPQAGDLILAIGGRTGRDGIHGATFSSGEMTDKTQTVNSGAVQIGNAIEEKRMSDALLALRDRGFIRAVTDCGAGGFSSAIGEMGSETGVLVELERALLKYPGLKPWEIWVSESQERMVLAIRPEHEVEAVAICRDLNVEAIVLGRFTDSHQLVVRYNGDTVCDLSMEFLHHGLPQRVMKAAWTPQHFVEPSEVPSSGEVLNGLFKAVMAHPNVCSKEQIVRQYDHGVQGTNVLPSFTGVMHDGPNDAVVLQPLLDKPYGVVVSHGLDPVLNLIDPYWGAMSACVEAIANAVAVGADPQELFFIDNFIWPFPDEKSLGALDRAVDACCDFMKAVERPFVSGKDSLSGTYRGKRRGKDVLIKIPPVLCVSAFGRIPDVAKTVSADFKNVGSRIVLVGCLDVEALGGSVLYDVLGRFVGNRMPKPDLAALPKIFAAVHRWIVEDRVLAVHDISGNNPLLATLAEMCFGGNVGAQIFLDRMGEGNAANLLFNETPGCFLAEFRQKDLDMYEELPGLVRVIGYTTNNRTITVMNRGMNAAGTSLLQVPVDELKAAWHKPMNKVFSHD
jgi:phosphoribosylformylglycinamidine synthase II